MSFIWTGKNSRTATISPFRLSMPAIITLNEYLDRTLFYRPRSFTREEFIAYMFAQSREFPESRAVLDEVTPSEEIFHRLDQQRTAGDQPIIASKHFDLREISRCSSVPVTCARASRTRSIFRDGAAGRRSGRRNNAFLSTTGR